jgi:type I restriction enzyme S subunit
MTGEWKKTNLGEICSDISYGYTASAKEEPTGPKFLRITDIVPDRINWKTVPYCDADVATIEKYELQNGDIVIARTGATTGYNKIIKNIEFSAVFASYLIRYKIDKEVAYPYYIGHILQSSSWYDYINAIAGGSAQPGANAKELASFEILLPPLPEQRAIASVLSSLDDKIDLLHRQNKTLEAMAETLFRQWFVEKADEEWDFVRLGDFVQTNVVSINKDTNLKTIRYLDTSSLTEGKIDCYQILDISNAPSRARRIVKHNDVLISTVRPNQKHYGVLKNPSKDMIVSTGFCVITCDKIDPHFVYIFLTTDEMTEYLHSIAEGSTSAYPSLKPSDIEGLEFQLPPQEKLDAFSEYAGNAWNKIEYNHNQIRTLEKLRDTLLPKLMSGEVRVEV